MKEFVANRLSSGNRILPDKVTVEATGVTLRVPGIFNGKEKTLMYTELNSISINNPLAGFSTITFETKNWDSIKCHGFLKADAEEIKRLVQAGIRGVVPSVGNVAAQAIVMQDNTAMYEAQRAQTEVEQRRLDLEEQRNREQRADTLRQQGRNKQAFVTEHWKVISGISVVVLIVLSYVWMSFSTSSSDKVKLSNNELDNELTKKDEQVQMLIHDGKKEEALKLIDELQHESHEQSEHEKGFMQFYSYADYWKSRRDKLRTEVLQEKENKIAVTENISPEQQQNNAVADNAIPVTQVEENKSESNSIVVLSDKAYFYTAPNLETKRKGYLIKGQALSYSKSEGDFIYVEYTNDNGATTNGWLLKSDIQRQ